MNANLIFWPMIILALVTLWLYVPMSNARVKAVREGRARASDFKLTLNEPEESRQLNNAIRNQFESPVLFYAACLAAHAAGLADGVMIVLAFLYAFAKTAHVAIFATTNRIRYRRPMFMATMGILAAMWVWLAWRLVVG